MEIRVFEDPEQTSRAVAGCIADVLAETPDAALGLPAGRTPLGVYRQLTRLYEARAIDFSRASAFTIDEFSGIGPDDPGSFRQFMERHLFNGVNFNRNRLHSLNGVAEDVVAECLRYDAEIDRTGGIDFQLLGIGLNGHIGFNEPAGELSARTHKEVLSQGTRASSADLFGGRLDRVPVEGLSMGMGTILSASTILLMATGSRKAACIERVVNGPLTTWLPASLLQLHRHVVLCLDRAAASWLARAR